MNETELLFTEVLNCERTSLYLNRQKRLDKKISSKISQVLKRRIGGEPIEYILGKCEFMGLEFKLNQDVLIPRPETEILVEVVIKQLSAVNCQLSACKILEIGTGSGCVAVSLAKLLPEAEIFATDISELALKVARENARLNNVESRIQFIHCDLFSSELQTLDSCDYIVSNPPYILTAEIGKLAAEVQFEPISALDGGRDGLDFYRRIIRESPGFLRKGGFLILEMGFGQCENIKEIFKLCKKFEVKEIIKDYNNIDRVIVATRK